MAFSRMATYALLVMSTTILCGCEGMVVTDVASLLDPTLKRSEVVGFVAGFGTTFAAFPDLFKMLKRRSAEGMNPTMAGIMGVFQISPGERPRGSRDSFAQPESARAACPRENLL